MSNFTEHVKGVGGLTALASAAGTSPAKTVVYKDVNGLCRVAGSGVVIAGQPEALSGLTLTTENDRGKTAQYVSMVGFRRHAVVNRTHADDRATDGFFFKELNDRFRFTVDVCATHENAKCERYYTTDEDGLEQSWADERVWCNPPYSHIAPWVKKAWESNAELVVMLLPANRTEQKWWQHMIEPHRDHPDYREHTPVSVEFLSGRLNFVNRDNRVERPPFGFCLVIWSRKRRFDPGRDG